MGDSPHNYINKNMLFSLLILGHDYRVETGPNFDPFTYTIRTFELLCNLIIRCWNDSTPEDLISK